MVGRGRGRSRHGPALPSRLNKEVSNLTDESIARNDGVSKAFAIADRKAQRKAKRQQKGQQRVSHQKHCLGQSSDAPPAEQLGPRKRKPAEPQPVRLFAKLSTRASSKGGSSFWKLQVDAQASKRARHANAKLQTAPAVRQKEAKQRLQKGKASRKATKFDELVEPASRGVSLSSCSIKFPSVKLLCMPVSSCISRYALSCKGIRQSTLQQLVQRSCTLSSGWYCSCRVQDKAA